MRARFARAGDVRQFLRSLPGERWISKPATGNPALSFRLRTFEKFDVRPSDFFAPQEQQKVQKGVWLLLPRNRRRNPVLIGEKLYRILINFVKMTRQPFFARVRSAGQNGKTSETETTDCLNVAQLTINNRKINLISHLNIFLPSIRTREVAPDCALIINSASREASFAQI